MHPSYRLPSPLVPSQHHASLPNTTEMLLRQNARTKLDHYLAASPSNHTGTSSCLSLPSFLPSYYLLPSSSSSAALSAASTSFLCGTSLSLNIPLCFLLFLITFVFPVSRCRMSCIVHSHRCSKPGIRASTFGSFGFPLLTGLFLFFFFFIKVDINVYVIYFFLFSINACFCTHTWSLRGIFYLN